MGVANASGGDALAVAVSRSIDIAFKSWNGALALDQQLRAEALLLGVDAPCWMLALFSDRVLWAVVDARGIVWPPDGTGGPDIALLDEFWLFGSRGELHCWRSGDGYRGRRRQDDDGGDPLEYLEEFHVLWGTAVVGDAPAPGWSTISEDRGARFILPATPSDNLLPWRLRVRSYVAYDDLGLAQIVDSRIIAVCDASLRPLRPNMEVIRR